MNVHAYNIVLLSLLLPCVRAFVPAPNPGATNSPSVFRVPVAQSWAATAPQIGWAFATEILIDAGARARAMQPELVDLKKQLMENKIWLSLGNLESVRMNGPSCKTEQDFADKIKKLEELELETHLIKAEAAAKRTYYNQFVSQNVQDADKADDLEKIAPELMTRVTTLRQEVESLYQDCGITV